MVPLAVGGALGSVWRWRVACEVQTCFCYRSLDA